MLADAIEIVGEHLRMIPNLEKAQAQWEHAMQNPNFRQFQDHQRIPLELIQILERESESILNLMKNLNRIRFFETLLCED